jgi:hypothetical protein
MLFIPNIIWTRHQPAGYDQSGENKVLLAFERTGQVCCTCCVLIFSNFNLAPFSAWSLWQIASFAMMVLYEICWIRYFAGEHTMNNFYRPLWFIPGPLATLPFLAFLLLGIYGKVIWLIISAVIIGIGHIGIHLEHAKISRAA